MSIEVPHRKKTATHHQEVQMMNQIVAFLEDNPNAKWGEVAEHIHVNRVKSQQKHNFLHRIIVSRDLQRYKDIAVASNGLVVENEDGKYESMNYG